jgi:acetyltransferase-like isoleucine patch superfamily enzyme
MNRLFDRLFGRYLEWKVRAILNQYLDIDVAQSIERNLLSHYLVFGDKSRLQIAETALVNNALFNLSSGRIIIEDYVFFGHNVSILTGVHDYRKFNKERQLAIPSFGRDVIIKQGAWISTNATIIGPCVIGEHSVVSACSLVKADVAPFTIVAGVPAKPIKVIERT